MPKCTINGQEIEVAQGTTIIEAYKTLSKDIAHYCWHPGLSVAGVCRLCMVEVQGNPKLQIACNTMVTEGMVINNVSEKVKDTVKWGLDFHLINHPLDCPICDQAGECGLQDQYMQFGKYDPEMAERKVKKRKVVSLGEKVVLDSERCILCSRCVRFTDEVTKTRELGIFNRGDHSEIGTFADKPLNNNYSLNTVDICPVGALTSKDFRFRQRVWYLKEATTICTGCSTGCNVKMYYNEEGPFRVKPVFNKDVNGYWMCDEGRDVYKFVSRKSRLMQAKVGQAKTWNSMDPVAAVQQVREIALNSKWSGDQVGLVLTGQYTLEETQALVDALALQFGSKQVFHWHNHPEKSADFDGILLRGDRNPNTAGVVSVLKDKGLSGDFAKVGDLLKAQSLKMLIVAGPENQKFYEDIGEKLKIFSGAELLVWLTACPVESLEQMSVEGVNAVYEIPMKTFAEKAGTYVNFKGLHQKVKAGGTFVASALTGIEVASLLQGQAIDVSMRPKPEAHHKTNYFTQQRGVL